ncbi:hypothetical protein PTI98_001750 [Pleurotus ostreatus]|nr:hypothetical protein PTI98_001750 [Pleurotus ostreatus]
MLKDFLLKPKHPIYEDTLLIPAYFAAFSASLLLIHTCYLVVSQLLRSSRPDDDAQNEIGEQQISSGFAAEVKAHVASHGGLNIFAYKVARLVGCLSLLGLSIATLIMDEYEMEDKQQLDYGYGDQVPLGWLGTLAKWGGKKRRHRRRKEVEQLTYNEWLQFAMCMAYLYASLLALLCLTTKPFQRVKSGLTPLISWLPTNLILLLLVTFGVYTYRDLYPLCTYTLSPVDLPAGFIKENAVLVNLLWAKIAVLFVTAIVIPLIMPRTYIPVDPKNPSTNPSPEQTCSPLSFILFGFLDEVIFLGYKMPHLPVEKLPPLADYDASSYLRIRSFKNIDPFSPQADKKLRKRHLFWKLMKTLRKEYALLSSLLLLYALAGFAAPIGVNRLLHYMEKRGEDAFVRPWTWLLWLFLGPMIQSVSWQAYIFVATRNLVRVEAMLTQLLFEHALRIRVKAETSSSSSEGSVKDASVASSSSNSGSSTPAASTPALPAQEWTEPGHEERDVSVTSTLIASNEDGSPTPSTRDSVGAKTLVGSIKSKLRSRFSKDKNGKKEPSKTAAKAPEAATDSSESGDGNLVGKLNNLVSTDLSNITDARDFIFLLIYVPIQVVLGITFLYVILGWSAFVGLAVMLLLFPAPGYVAQIMQKYQQQRMKRTDARVQNVTETMNVIRMIKLFGWERKVNEKIAEFREAELTWIWKKQILELLNNSINNAIPVAIMVATYGTYVGTVIMKEILTASVVFSSMVVFDILREQLHMSIWTLSTAVQGKVSLDRINDFLQNTELLDEFAEESSGDDGTSSTNNAMAIGNSDVSYLSRPPAERSQDIGFSDAMFAWSVDDKRINDGAATPSRRKFVLRVDGELIFKRNAINIIIGPTGSGKTSMLMALLSEMHFMPSGPSSWYNLPRDGGVSYAAQESWVQNETIRDNILFGAPLDEERYKKVLYQCCLERDLQLFDAGDQTEVGEKGLTLSGGQKARITLARAIYSHAEIILLDDVLAALDVHTSKWIVDKCFRGDLINNRTVILVTHNVALATPVAGFVVSLGSDGRIVSKGGVAEVLADSDALKQEVAVEQAALAKAEETIDDAQVDPEDAKIAGGKLIAAEEVELGHVGWPAIKMYLVGLGGNHPFIFFVTVLGGLLMTEGTFSFLTWFLGHWATQYETHDPSEVSTSYYLGVYGCITLVSMTFYTLTILAYIYGTLRASRTIHKQLIESVLGTTLRWLDITPTSRIVTRCTQDIRAVDDRISQNLDWLTELTVGMLIKFGAVLLFTPIFIGPGILVAVLGGWLGQVYIASQLSVKRGMSNAKAPVIGHFGAAMAGITSIRAYGVQEAFKAESLVRIDKYTRASRTFYNLNRWICIRIDAFGNLFAVALAAYLLYGVRQGASNTGFSLNMAVGFSSMILYWVRVYNEFEVQGNSLERIQGYTNIDQEPKPTQNGTPPAYWPASGDLRVEKLSAKYSADGPEVLHDVSFHIKSGERVGVVGRTGSGKSSLTLSLLRCIPTNGEVYLDGMPTGSINLDALRTNITIIPQVPELLSGTLRQNLDPFSQFDDATLNSALRAAGLFSLQTDDDEGRITLDSPIASGGSNLSVGQRQILALARAIVRGSKLLILDEATSAIDYKTDSVIQSSLRHELGNITLITIAHRLQTIMDADKIVSHSSRPQWWRLLNVKLDGPRRWKGC